MAPANQYSGLVPYGSGQYPSNSPLPMQAPNAPYDYQAQYEYDQYLKQQQMQEQQMMAAMQSSGGGGGGNTGTGAALGTAAGAAIGTAILPGVGTMAGAAIGGGVGGGAEGLSGGGGGSEGPTDLYWEQKGKQLEDERKWSYEDPDIARARARYKYGIAPAVAPRAAYLAATGEQIPEGQAPLMRAQHTPHNIEAKTYRLANRQLNVMLAMPLVMAFAGAVGAGAWLFGGGSSGGGGAGRGF